MIRRLVHVHLWIAAFLSLVVIGTGLIWNTRVAAGSDAYGYVSQADLWLRPSIVRVRQSCAARPSSSSLRSASSA